MPSILIKSATLVSSTGEEKVDVLIEDGIIKKITQVSSFDSAQDDTKIISATGLLLFPGFIDCHVHFREPGFPHKATMKSEAAAALAGGVTTVCDMPNTNPPTVTIAALADKVRRASDIHDVDIRFFFGVTQEMHLAALTELLTGGNAELDRLRARCCGVKLYFDHSTGNQKIQEDLIQEVFQVCAAHDFPLVAHCEDPVINAEAAQRFEHDGSIHPTVARHSCMRPPESEAVAIKKAIGFARTHGTQLHIAHLTTKQGIDLVRAAKREGLHVTCEVAPHHLLFTTEDYKALGTLVKMNPPLRTQDHVDALWEGIEDGTVDCIATDHAPHTMEEKLDSDPLQAPGGVPGVEVMIPLLLSVVLGSGKKWKIKNGKLKMTAVLRLCFENPNRIFRLGKAGITEGAPADLVLIDPTKEWTIEGKKLHSKCHWSPYEGWKVKGKPVKLIS